MLRASRPMHARAAARGLGGSGGGTLPLSLGTPLAPWLRLGAPTALLSLGAATLVRRLSTRRQ